MLVEKLTSQLEELKSFGGKYTMMVSAFRFDIATQRYQLVISRAYRQLLAERHGVAGLSFPAEIEFPPFVDLKKVLDDYERSNTEAVERMKRDFFSEIPTKKKRRFPLPIMSDRVIFQAFLEPAE